MLAVLFRVYWNTAMLKEIILSNHFPSCFFFYPRDVITLCLLSVIRLFSVIGRRAHFHPVPRVSTQAINQSILRCVWTWSECITTQTDRLFISVQSLQIEVWTTLKLLASLFFFLSRPVRSELNIFHHTERGVLWRHLSAIRARQPDKQSDLCSVERKGRRLSCREVRGWDQHVPQANGFSTPF